MRFDGEEPGDKVNAMIADSCLAISVHRAVQKSHELIL